jgi:hypothetical protein
MASFLKIVSGVYLVIVWSIFMVMVASSTNAFVSLGIHPGQANLNPLIPVLSFLSAVVLSIPAVALFAFGQVVGDIRIIRNNSRLQSNHLDAMRSYYEPSSASIAPGRR